jgi:trigger factor
MMVGDYDSLDALKTAVRENLETEALQNTEAEYLDTILEAMIEDAVKIEYPPQAIDREADVVMNQMERNLASTGLPLDNYLQMVGKTRDMYRREMRPTAEERLRKRLVLTQVAREEGIQADPEEIEAEIDRLTDMLGEEADQMREVLDTPAGRLSIADDLIAPKVQERVKQIARGEAPPLEPTEPGAEAQAEGEAQPGEEPGAEPDQETQAEPAEEMQAEAESADSDGPVPDTAAEGEEPAADDETPNQG